MKILGIDPGSRVTGYGLVEHHGNSTRYLDSGCIRLPDKWKLADKLLQISNELGALIENKRPDCASIEQIFFAHNARSALILGHVRGVILLKMAETGLPIHEYPPLQVKQAVVGVGRATKDQVIHMVQILLNRRQDFKEDEADALASAITHAHLHPTLERMQGKG